MSEKRTVKFFGIELDLLYSIAFIIFLVVLFPCYCYTVYATAGMAGITVSVVSFMTFTLSILLGATKKHFEVALKGLELE